MNSSLRLIILSATAAALTMQTTWAAPNAPNAAASIPASNGAEPAVQGTYGDWSLYTFQDNGRPACYLASRMLKSSESVPGRTAAYVLITNRPTEGKKGIVSVVAGYPYEKGGQVLLTVGRKQFHLFTDRDTAWAEDTFDTQIVAAIHGGSKLVVTGRAKGGVATTDTYSLKGAATALTALDMACPLPRKPVAAVPHRKKKVQ